MEGLLSVVGVGEMPSEPPARYSPGSNAIYRLIYIETRHGRSHLHRALGGVARERHQQQLPLALVVKHFYLISTEVVYSAPQLGVVVGMEWAKSAPL